MPADPLDQHAQQATRRAFLGDAARGVGAMALGTMLAADEASAYCVAASVVPHVAPRAKRVVCLLQSGGMSQVDLFDHKPTLTRFHGTELPAGVRGDQRLTGMTSGQSSYPVTQPMAPGKYCGAHQTWISNLLPHTQGIADRIAIIKSMHTEAINHDPAVTFVNTGNQQPGYPSMGAWISYGLGSGNRDLPTFITMTSQGSGKNPGQPIFSRLWGSGFLPSTHQGVGLRPGANPVLYLSNPPGVSRGQRRALLDDLERMNHLAAQRTADAETLARIDAYEMAFRMQMSVPELTDLSGESAATIESYGPDAARPGSYAANCLLARRLLERGVRFVQLFHRGWDQHIALARQLPRQCQDIDQPTAALVNDLDQRGLLDDTLVLFATEFGRTVFSQGAFDSPGAGRDHHGRCFTIWMAGGGVRGGLEYGRTDDFSYNIVDKPVHLRDMHATLLHCLGIDFQRFTYRFRGLDVGLTGVEPAHVVKDLLLNA
ncbi:hypothetical protein Pla175_29680 [Pirellulimonas nuda]|uniref:Sulfatase n=1 Tax=Pirellulimonas nuda TaxID=2528009 RepID=A0A518DDQ0_9BACT|nr:DUF1501 domain-containing protein [Pirellulimonas nuda]QDU89576.1 hypothetical protein Pla175_29680 [Pirellulimonas nuda]